MSLLMRQRTILAKTESSYGVDPTATGASNAILLRNLNVNPLNAELAQRDLIRPYLGNSDSLVATKSVSLDFEVELAGSGVRGVEPAYGPLLKACAMSETAATQSITSITRSSSTATATKTSHGYSVNDVVRISGAVETEYNGDVTVLTVPTADTFTYAVSGSPSTPATGTILAGTTVTYAPISDSFSSVAIYFNIDGVNQKILGCMGSVEFSINTKQIPIMKFNMTGLYAALTDTSAPTPTYTGFMVPKVANTANTSAFSLLSYSAILQSLSFNVNNSVVYRSLIGSEAVMVVDRKTQGTAVIELPTIAAKDYFTAAVNGTTGALSILHGTVGGNKVQLDASRVVLQNPTFSDDSGIAMLNVPFVVTPTSGNDEFSIVVK